MEVPVLVRLNVGEVEFRGLLYRAIPRQDLREGIRTEVRSILMDLAEDIGPVIDILSTLGITLLGRRRHRHHLPPNFPEALIAIGLHPIYGIGLLHLQTTLQRPNR